MYHVSFINSNHTYFINNNINYNSATQAYFMIFVNYIIIYLAILHINYIMIETTREANIYSGTRAIGILTKIRAKCEKCWGSLKNATVPNTGRQATAVYLCECDATDVWLRTRANHFPSHAKVLTSPRRRSVREEIVVWKRERERARVFPPFFIFSFFGNFFSLHFFSPSFARSRSDFSTPSSKPKLCYSLALCFPRESAHYVVSCRKAKPWLLILLHNPLESNSRSRKHNSR